MTAGGALLVTAGAYLPSARLDLTGGGALFITAGDAAIKGGGLSDAPKRNNPVSGRSVPKAAKKGVRALNLIARLVDEELPVGRENAEKWVSSIDDLSLPLAKILRANECLDEKHGCKDPEYCVFGGKRASCMVTSCGDGACKACLDVFGDLRKLAVKGWCAYTCQQGTAIPGIKLVLQIRILGEMSACLPLTTPVP